MFWWRKKALVKYERQVADLKRTGREWGMTEEEVEVMYQDSLRYVNEEEQRNINVPSSRWPVWCKNLIITLLIITACYGLNLYKPAHNFVERNIQEVIYPFMKFYRRVTLPIVQQFPVLTELYDESCLVENPYFKVADMECWPCENARVVFNMTDSIANTHVGLPFIMKLADPAISLSELREAYLSNKDLIASNSGRIGSNVGWSSIDELLGGDRDLSVDHPDAHISWKINRMETGRALRALLKPPLGREVPPHATAVGIERFLLVDGASSPHYVLPSPEGANVFVKQLWGQRLIVLEPAPECRDTCRRLSVLLDQRHILWYNWWYWRPRSLPAHNASAISIAFLGSTT